jgi:hypothetical protein
MPRRCSARAGPEMSEFDELRSLFAAARRAETGAADAAFVAKERVARLQRRLDELERAFDPDDERHVSERERMESERAAAERAVAAAEREHATARRVLGGIRDDFAPLTDPRDGIGNLDDSLPILLLPVRLETRFASTERGPELWVRIYPDDCSIDTFDATLSEAEIASAKLYWAGVWEAGGIQEDERGAWRNLVASHGSGRAEWIVSQYRPVNAGERPAKADPNDLILVVPTQTALLPGEPVRVAAFWRRVWLADGDRAKRQAARAELESAVGAARAAVIVRDYRPINLKRRPPGSKARAEVNVSTAFLRLPSDDDVDTKSQSWARAPKAVALPDRFVFLGYAGEGQPTVVMGNSVTTPLVAGPDPSAGEAEQLHQHDGDMVVPDEMAWMVDFDRAVDAGMGLRVELDPVRARAGFDRVLVVGLRLGSDETEAKAELEELFVHHHLGRSGFELLPQGTPTNNTEAAPSALDRVDDPDASFDDLEPTVFNATAWTEVTDGQWFAEYLGIDTSVLETVRNATTTDQADARAMNTALWPATLGYWMETMMQPAFGSETVEATRTFFTRFVNGRGAIPAMRIGRQPYGILPSTPLSRLGWLSKGRDGHTRAGLPRGSGYLARLYEVLRRFDADWRTMAYAASHVGKAGDAHQLLLDIVGLHPSSVEFAQRYGDSLDELYNRLNLGGWGNLLTPLLAERLARSARDLLTSFGYQGDDPEMLELFFSGRRNLLNGPLVDDAPASEAEALRVHTTDGRNYLRWLIDAANISLDALYAQAGFIDDRPPPALLYLMLRHALQLGYHDTSIRLHESAGLLDADASRVAKIDHTFVHIAEGAGTSESKYALLYKPEEAITGSRTMMVGDYIGASLYEIDVARHLQEQLAALEHLEGASTARLERAFAEHIDCCSYRLDAWLLGLVHVQLTLMRNLTEGRDANVRQGIYLGAYAWLEDLRPERRTLEDVKLAGELAKVFKPNEKPVLQRDSANQGYVHAPSLNQAVAASVLRAAYESHGAGSTMAVDLSSERVRTALALLEGIRAGQSLGALLGYQFERGLHDRHGLAEVDKFIYDIRKAFPLASDRLASTKTPEGVSIEAIEARNVVDGLALVEHIRAANNKLYPFGKSLPDASTTEAAAINAEVTRLLESHDAVSDLALAEGVYQAVLGNYDRVASTLDAYGKAQLPAEPQVVRTPVDGTGLTHRVALHLEAGRDLDTSPVAGFQMSPRARAEPALNAWLAGVLPPPQDIGCVVVFKNAASGATVERQVTMRDLRLQPIDLIELVGGRGDQAMSELDDRIVRSTIVQHSPRPDAPIEIRYMEKKTANFSVFEAMPLIRHLYRLLHASRPLRASDMVRTSEATGEHDAPVVVEEQRVDRTMTALTGVRSDLDDLRTELQGPLSDLPNRRAEITDHIDEIIDDVMRLLARAARFGLAQAGWGFAYDFKRKVFASVLSRGSGLAETWRGRLTDFDDLMTAYGQLPNSTPAYERIDLLLRAERLISTATTSPVPTDPDDLEDALVPKRMAFEDRLEDFEGLANTSRTALVDIVSDVEGWLPITQFDPATFSLEPERDEMVRFAQDAVNVLTVVIAEIDARREAAQGFIDLYDAAAEPADRAAALIDALQALLGEDFIVLPEFELAGSHRNEMAKAVGDGTAGLLFEYMKTELDDEFPLDTWLYSVARVRDPMHAWEQITMLAGALQRPEPQLTAAQLPYRADDSWLGLEFPPQATLDVDRLLYTAHFTTPFDATAPQCGVLIDEWSEVIPSSDATTGISFHYDRPSTEAPQTMLLVTPADFTGAWRWDDLVDALNETLDLAKRRAVEPAHVDATPYAWFLPATVMAVTVNQLSISANLAFNNNVQAFVETE